MPEKHQVYKIAHNIHCISVLFSFLENVFSPEPFLNGLAYMVLLLLNNSCLLIIAVCTYRHLAQGTCFRGIQFISVSSSQYTLPFRNFVLENGETATLESLSVEIKDVIKPGLYNITYNSKLWNTMKSKEQREVLCREKLEI